MCGRVINKVFSSLDAQAKTFDDICNDMEEKRKSISNALCRLIQLEIAERQESGIYKLTEKGLSLKTSGQEIKFTSGPSKGSYRRVTPGKNSLRSKVWRLMRLQKKFTIDELMGLAVDGNEKLPRNNIGRYVNALKHAGYLYELKNREKGIAPTSNGFKRYALLKDTGNKAPILRRTLRQIYDPNTGEVISWQA